MRVRKKPLTTDTIIAIAATVTSVCALLITVYQTVLSREQQLNSVWPYLTINTVTEDASKATIIVTNNGVGPAIVEQVAIRYRGQSYKTMVDVVQAMSKQLGRGTNGISWTHSIIEKGVVIPQGQAVSWISTINTADYQVFFKELEYVTAVVHFKSMYEEHWHSNYNIPQEDAVIKE